MHRVLTDVHVAPGLSRRQLRVIHYAVSYDDYNSWVETHDLPTFELERRADKARNAHQPIFLLSKQQLTRWRQGKLTPWRVPDHLTVTARKPLRSWPVLASQIR